MNTRNSNTKIALTFIGTLIGAGFASGKEIALFFGTRSILSPILSGLLSAFFAYLFLELGREGDILETLFKKNKALAGYAVSFINLVIFCAMLSASELAVNSLFGISGGGLISGLFALSVIVTNSKRIKTLNTFITPVVIILIMTIFSINPNFNVMGSTDLISPLLYSSFNILTGGFLISRMAKGITHKQSIEIGVLISVILVTLTTIIYFISKSYPSAVMPVIEMAKTLNLDKLSSAVIYLCILTTMMGTLSVASKDSKKAALIMLITCYPIALLGFDTIVNTAYPAMAIVGILFVVIAIKSFVAIKSGKKDIREAI